MAITKMTQPTGGAPLTTDDYSNHVAINEQLINNLPKNTFLLSEWDTLTEPEISLGVNIQHGGSFYKVDTADEAIAGAPADGRVYIKLAAAGAPLGSILTATFVTSLAGYSWDNNYQGFYHADGSQILPFILVKFNSTSWLKFNYFDYRDQQESSMADITVLPFMNGPALYNDDTVEGVPQPASTVFFPFCNPNLSNSDNDIPSLVHNANWLPVTDTEAKFADRGFYHLAEGAVVYDYVLGNEGFFRLRIQPNFEFDVGSNVYFLDNRSGATEATRLILVYLAADDTLALYIDADAGNHIRITSAAFLSTVALNIPMDIIGTWSKSGNVAKLFINGVEVLGNVTTGTGITTLAMTGDQITFGSRNSTNYPAPNFSADMYILDCLFGSTYDIDTDNYDGSGTTKPNYESDWLAFLNHTALIKGDGSAGFSSLDCEKINNGAGYFKEWIVDLPTWNMDTVVSCAIPMPQEIVDSIAQYGKNAVVLWHCSIIADNGIMILDLSLGGDVYLDLTNSLFYPRKDIGGFFDNASFDAVTDSRGQLYVKYRAPIS